MNDKAEYYEELCDEIGGCLDEHTKHAVLIVYDNSNGQVKTYSVNATYDIVQMLVGTAARFVGETDINERTLN